MSRLPFKSPKDAQKEHDESSRVMRDYYRELINRLEARLEYANRTKLTLTEQVKDLKEKLADADRMLAMQAEEIRKKDEEAKLYDKARKECPEHGDKELYCDTCIGYKKQEAYDDIILLIRDICKRLKIDPDSFDFPESKEADGLDVIRIAINQLVDRVKELQLRCIECDETIDLMEDHRIIHASCEDEVIGKSESKAREEGYWQGFDDCKQKNEAVFNQAEQEHKNEIRAIFEDIEKIQIPIEEMTVTDQKAGVGPLNWTIGHITEFLELKKKYLGGA